ncbi:hypothetical protein ACN26P_003348 [Vibrio cholerae]|nr:hypothetical protein [Vibrio cholerae]
MKRIGFVLLDQDREMQSYELNKSGCDAVIESLCIDDAIEQLSEGDVLVLWRMDKLAQSVEELKPKLDRVQGCGACLELIFEGLNTCDDGEWLSQLIDVVNKL